MQQSGNKTWKVGMFVTIGLILLVGALFYIGRQRNLFGSTFRLRAQFSNVGGLQEGSNVRFGGINVGTVEGIELVNDSTVMVSLAIRDEVRKFVKKDAQVTIGSEGLMGDRVVVIFPGVGNETIVSDNDVLTSRPAVETDQIMTSLKTSADNAANITSNLAEIAEKINKGHGVISRLIGDTALSNNLNKTVVNLRQGSQGLNENMEAAKHNFLLRGYFKKKKREEEKKKKEAEQKKQDAQTPQP